MLKDLLQVAALSAADVVHDLRARDAGALLQVRDHLRQEGAAGVHAVVVVAVLDAAILVELVLQRLGRLVVLAEVAQQALLAFDQLGPAGELDVGCSAYCGSGGRR